MKSLELLISSVRKLQQEESNNYTNGYHSRKKSTEYYSKYFQSQPKSEMFNAESII